MLKNLRTALAAVGGAQALIAVAAITWGLGRLQSIAEERQAQIDHLGEYLAERTDLARALQDEFYERTYSDHEGRRRWLADASLVEESHPLATAEGDEPQ